MTAERVAPALQQPAQHVVVGDACACFALPDVEGRLIPAGDIHRTHLATLRAEFARTSDEARLAELAEEINRAVIDEGVVVPLGQFVIPAGYSTKLTGVLPAPVALFWNIEKAE